MLIRLSAMTPKPTQRLMPGMPSHLICIDRSSLLILFGVQCRNDFQSAVCFGGSDSFEDGFIVCQRDALPVVGDGAEEGMLDGVPLRCAWRIVANGYCQPVAVGEFGLQISFPNRGTGAIAASAIA